MDLVLVTAPVGVVPMAGRAVGGEPQEGGAGGGWRGAGGVVGQGGGGGGMAGRAGGEGDGKEAVFQALQLFDVALHDRDDGVLHDAALGEAAGLDDHREDAGGRHGEDEGRDEHFDEGEGASAAPVA